MKTYDFADILALAHQYGMEHNLVGKHISVSVKRDENDFFPRMAFGTLILIGESGYQVVSEMGEKPESWGNGVHLRIETEDQDTELFFEVSPEGHLRFVSASSPAEVNLFTFRHNQELLESSALALTLLNEFTEQAEESEVDQFAVELKGIVSQTFFYVKNEPTNLYLTDDETALPAMTQAILDSYFEPVKIHVSGFNTPEKRVFEREWDLERGEAREEGVKVVPVPEDVISALQAAAEETGRGARGKVDPKLSDEEKEVLDALFDPSLEDMHLLTLVDNERGPIAETFVDSVVSDGKSHLFVADPDVLGLIAQTKASDVVVMVSRLVEGETVTRAFSTEDLHELTEDELQAL